MSERVKLGKALEVLNNLDAAVLSEFSVEELYDYASLREAVNSYMGYDVYANIHSERFKGYFVEEVEIEEPPYETEELAEDPPTPPKEPGEDDLPF